jgi:hypothetical protein
MQTHTTVLVLLLAHLLGDFLFQSNAMVEGKRKRRLTAYVAHGAAHYSTSLLCLLLFVRPQRLVPGAVLVALAVLGHLLLDWATTTVARSRRMEPGAWLFLMDQLAHIAWLVLLVHLFDRRGLDQLLADLEALRSTVTHLLPLGILYMAVIFAGGHLIRLLLRPLERRLQTLADSTDPTLPAAGMQIGWLERFLVLTAILADSPEAAGLVVAAKSIFRFPEIKGRHLTEYFLIGTLLSVALAVLGAAAFALLAGPGAARR